jgi:UDP-N-acetylglucosamine 1-carboxyvinyltransferase
MIEVLQSLGARATLKNHTLVVRHEQTQTRVPLELGARLRTSSMVIGPLLARFGEAIIPNPGGCRIGARPIDRHIEGLKQMGAVISYESEDGFFHAKAQTLTGVTYTFPKNTHTGTETLLLAAVLATGTTVLKNAAEEVEVDDLIGLLVKMGANIQRTGNREITIVGVPSLHGTEYSIMSDRNEEVTIAVAAAITSGHITVKNSQLENLGPFLEVFQKSGGVVEKLGGETTYSRGSSLVAQDIVTKPHPGFMTDWQAPWAVLMTQAQGVSTIHETVFESRFSYVSELSKMGASIEFFDPDVTDPSSFYNFNWPDRVEGYHQGIKITGPSKLHNAVLEMDDLRAGATLVLAALVATGESYIHGVEQIDRGYERIEERLASLGAVIKRVQE